MSKTDPKLITKKKNKKDVTEDSGEDIFSSMGKLDEEPQGRRSVIISDNNKKGAKKKINMDMFKIVDRLGNGAFGTVYLVSLKKPPKN